MLVDFHCHSTASDGTFSPASIAEEAVRRGFRAMALTDHDNGDGLEEFVSAGKRLGLKTIPGVELSIEPGATFDRFHLLALNVDIASPRFRAFLRKILDGRNARNGRIFANFHRLGIDVRPEPHGEVLARPHFARWLVEHGYATDIKDAFAKYLLDDSPAETRCFEDRYHPSQEETFREVHAAGGLCVMAHPKYWRSNWKDVGPDFAAAERELAKLREMGLDGVESLYQANTPVENVEFTRIATKLGYLRTAGSDFHGANKPTIPLGMEVTDDFIAPVLERFGII